MATTYYNVQIAVIDASGNINVLYPRTKASLVSLTATSYSDVESCLAALGTAAFKNTSNTYNATGTTVATTKAVYDAYTALNSNKMAKTLTPIYNTSVLLGDGVTKQVTLTEKITQGRQVCVCLHLQSINRSYSPIFYVNAIPRNYSFALDDTHICVVTIYDSTRMDIIIFKSVGASAFTDLYLTYVYI